MESPLALLHLEASPTIALVMHPETIFTEFVYAEFSFQQGLLGVHPQIPYMVWLKMRSPSSYGSADRLVSVVNIRVDGKLYGRFSS